MKPLKRHEWMRQPLPYIKDETKEQRKERREIYLYQRSLPAPIPYVVLHGSHTKLPSASTVRVHGIQPELGARLECSAAKNSSIFWQRCRMALFGLFGLVLTAHRQFRRWWFVDARDQSMGRLATQVNPTPHCPPGHLLLPRARRDFPPFRRSRDPASSGFLLQIVRVIMGKHKPIYDPSFVVGDFVVVVNAEKSSATPPPGDPPHHALRCLSSACRPHPP